MSQPVPANSLVLLPDHLFFTRVVPVAGAAGEAEVAAQAELAIEALSPFPLAQLYHGFFWPPGGEHALVYAAYRKRFTAEQMESWSRADLVIPAFAASLGLAPATPARLLAPCAGGLTLIEWRGPGALPAQVVSGELGPDATPEAREALRTELLAQAAGEGPLLEPAAPFAAESADDEGAVFRAGELTARLPAGQWERMDVRDKEQLAARRREHGRDQVLWRIFLGTLAALAACVALELGLIGGKLWLKSRATAVAAQTPAVQAIMTAQGLANRINELSTKRLRPFEMLTLLNEKRPASIQFLRATTNGLYTLEVDAQTSAPNDVGGYQAALNAAPGCASVAVRDLRMRNGVATFTLVVTFQPAALLGVASS